MFKTHEEIKMYKAIIFSQNALIEDLDKLEKQIKDAEDIKKRTHYSSYEEFEQVKKDLTLKIEIWLDKRPAEDKDGRIDTLVRLSIDSLVIYMRTLIQRINNL